MGLESVVGVLVSGVVAIPYALVGTCVAALYKRWYVLKKGQGRGWESKKRRSRRRRGMNGCVERLLLL